jgi:predicted dehydrogenase
MEPVKLGLVGLGGMGQSHLSKEADLEEVRFTAVTDARKDVVDETAAKHGVPAFYSADALIESGLCEAVLIAAPHPFHPTVAIRAAEAGLHVLTEKPLAVTVAEGDAMLAAACKAGVKLGIMFQTRTVAAYLKAKELLDAGAIGRVYRTTLVASNWYRSQAYYDSGSWRGTWAGEGGGVIMNQAPHSIDLFIWLGGMPSRVTASVETRFHRIEVEDTASVLLEYPDGKTGYFYATTGEWPGENRIELTGTAGKLVIDGTPALRLYRMPKTITEEIAIGTMWGKPEPGVWEDVPVENAPASHAAVVQQFARAIRLGEPLIATGEDGLRALEFANAVLLSGNRRKTVELPVSREEYEAFIAEKREGR